MSHRSPFTVHRSPFTALLIDACLTVNGQRSTVNDERSEAI